AAIIHCGDRSTPIILLVMTDVLDDVLLGMDFLCGIGATVQCGGQALNLMPDEHTKPPWARTRKTVGALGPCAEQQAEPRAR
ncbi:hypothetical protein KR032_000353, partial [Drosophila birchii]